jgi:membrane-bound metal-dependent hydrolase YbcI (DUF457 family)
MLFAILSGLIDADVFLFMHRSPLHSMFILLLLASPFATLFFLKRQKSLALALLFALLLHPILDLNDLTPIFWPLYQESITINTKLLISVSRTPRFIWVFQPKEVPIAFSAFESFDAPIFTTEGLLISLFLLAPIILQERTKLMEYATYGKFGEKKANPKNNG